MLSKSDATVTQNDGAPPLGEHFDVLVIGAGLSGICAGYYLKTTCPTRSFAILEARESLGGTWDLFKYPGIRSDSDLYTFGFSFAPWEDDKAIADGPLILDYLKRTAKDFGIEPKIRFGHKVVKADWDSARGLWRIEAKVAPGGSRAAFTCNFLYSCTGYYDFDEGYLPAWPGVERFKGPLVHPQHWPSHLDFAGKEVIVIGSGATAVTLAPAMSSAAAHVTIVQRSPTYIVSMPARDRIANALKRALPRKVAYGLSRWKNILLTMFFYNLARLRPAGTKKQILKLAKAELPPGYDAEKHFSPRYNPWDQRLCLVPDGDLFREIRAGRVSIVTDDIEAFTETGLRMRSGQDLRADIVIAATGLKLKLLGGIDLTLDGAPFDFSKCYIYKGMMFSGLPNFVYSIGYTNASWTLKCELIARYFCRLLNHMDRHGYRIATPRLRGDVGQRPAIDLTSGYIQRSITQLPKQGAKKPWKLHQNYALDLVMLSYGAIEDGTMEFLKSPSPTEPDASPSPAKAAIAQEA